jgi:hypothetical protein
MEFHLLPRFLFAIGEELLRFFTTEFEDGRICLFTPLWSRSELFLGAF